ncbi:hypothetical protein C6P46_005458 [Rhodotorula mucilaginosa]|uniref:G-patch domain-containing protein n=1 Tax=Rhodotorula mucilaginosa TaxID=5537 RepID=A0A9P6W7M0_RHOMI|nr:hypothetical protein C6P46_005458 [Rhodotorula mucilaginosa]
MGLAGATKKQRIQDDPRNLRWAQDTSAPGFRLLASMGWNPESNPSLGNAESQAAIIANGGSVFSARKIASIPLAKDDNLGIGMKRGTGAHVVGSLRAIGVAPVSGANAVGPGSGSTPNPGFVSAGSGTATPQDGVTGGGSGGGEFGNLLARLNKLKEMNGGVISQSSASPSPAPDSKKKRKRSGSSSSSSSSSSDDSSSDESEAAAPVASTSQTASPAPPAPSAAALALLKNPRMAARSKHLRAKRLATASNASAMAEILGLAPSATASPSSSLAGSPAPAGAMRPALAVNGPRPDGWPEVPERGSSAIVAVTTTTTTTTTTMTTSEASTPAAAAAMGGDDDKAHRKAEKAARKAEKEARKAEKAAKKAAKEEAPAPERKARSPSPEFKVHSAQHDPFKVTAEVPTATRPTGLASVFGNMFARASSGGMGATFVPPTFAPASSSATTLPATFEQASEPTAAAAPDASSSIKNKTKKDKKSKRKEKESEGARSDKPAKEKKRKAVDVQDDAVESKEERKARKEAKRAKKEAKAAKANKVGE